jgi:hypothetical protein
VELAVLLGVRKKLRKEEYEAHITKAAEARSKKEQRKASRQGQKGKKGEEKTDTKEDDHIPDPNPPAYDLEGYVADPPREHVLTVLAVDSKST